METILCHFWRRGKDGDLVLYEAAYQTHWLRTGVVCHVKVPCSERPCDCPERAARRQPSAPVLN
jgi:hypothetical protein